MPYKDKEKQKECMRLHREQNKDKYRQWSRDSYHRRKRVDYAKKLERRSKTLFNFMARKSLSCARRVLIGFEKNYCIRCGEMVGSDNMFHKNGKMKWRVCRDCFNKNVRENRDYSKQYKRIISNPVKRTEVRIRQRIGKALKSAGQNTSVSGGKLKYLCCTAHEAAAHIESLFTEGMTWDNYGEWHIDHIMPCSSFDLSDELERTKCFHWKNLQPLWARDNMLKSDKVPF